MSWSMKISYIGAIAFTAGISISSHETSYGTSETLLKRCSPSAAYMALSRLVVPVGFDPRTIAGCSVGKISVTA